LAANSQILAVFDLDGTLVRAPDPVHVAGFDHALRAVFGTGASVEALPKSGRLDRDLVRDALLSVGVTAPARADGDAAAWADQVEQVMAVMGRYYRLRVHEGDRLDWVLGGVSDLLRKLHAAGIATAVATGSARLVGETKLAAAGLAAHFPAGAFGDEAADRADLIRQALRHATEVYGRRFLAANAVVIGDAPVDIEAAREIGARVVAVASGRFGTDALDEHGPDALFPDLANVDNVVRAIRG
jgi:phosphoglycolate phosphatase